MKNGRRQLPERNQSLQGVSDVLDVPAVQSLVSLPGYSASPLVSSTNLVCQRNLACKTCKLLEIKHVLPLISPLCMCGTLFLLCACKEAFLLLKLNLRLINYHLINQNIFQI